jgi:calcineurin-like phosphoesterase family protein
MTKFFTSDVHFNDEKTARLRGFDSVKKHNTAVINSINEAIKGDEDPELFILGDLTKSISIDSLEILRTRVIPRIKVPREKMHFILGNHDPKLTQFEKINIYRRMFGDVCENKIVDIYGLNFALSHYPFKQEMTIEGKPPEESGVSSNAYSRSYSEHSVNDDGSTRLLYGHIHSKEVLFKGNSMHIGWDAWKEPVNGHVIHDMFQAVSNND